MRNAEDVRQTARDLRTVAAATDPTRRGSLWQAAADLDWLAAVMERCQQQPVTPVNGVLRSGDIAEIAVNAERRAILALRPKEK